ITEIEELANRQELQVNINHVSSLPFIYLNYVKEFKIATLEKKSYKNAIKKAEDNFARFIERLEYGVKDIANQLKELEEKERKIKREKIKLILEDIRNIKLAAYFLPRIENKLYIIKDIECLEFIADSLNLNAKIKGKESNEVLDLIYHAKAHYFSTKALEISQLSSKTQIDRTWVEQRYSQTFIQGLDVELRLFELTRQFLFLNTIIDKIAQSYKLAITKERSVAQKYEAVINSTFNQFELFEAINSRISEDCKELLNHKNFFSIENTKINWDTIKAKKQLADTLILFLEAVKKTILGYAANNNKEYYKAASSFNEGAKFTSKASNYLQLITEFDSAFSQLAKTSYEYSILLKELERNSRDEKKIQKLPLEQLLGVLKQLTFLS
ncbi:MAG: hypothetical protein ACTSX6_08600, partial [Candidatus Heimdallarchaeaceae archaeon]